MKSKYFPLAIVAMMLTVVITGCSGTIDKISSKFDKAIAEIRELRVAVTSESGQWRTQLSEMQTTLTSDVKDVINEDLRGYTDKTIENIGKEARCEVDFIEKKLLVYLKAVEDALIAKREEIKASGGSLPEGETPEAVIAKVIESVGHMKPHVCHTPGEVKFDYTNAYGQPPTFSTNADTFRVIGFALKRPKEETEKYSLHVWRKDEDTGKEKSTPIANAMSYLTVVSAYHMNIAFDDLTKDDVIKQNHTKISLNLGDDEITAIKLSYGDAPKEPPPAPPRVRHVNVQLYVTDDDKDEKDWIRVTVRAKNQVVFTLDGAEKTAPKVWPDGSGPYPYAGNVKSAVERGTPGTLVIEKFKSGDGVSLRVVFKATLTNGTVLNYERDDWKFHLEDDTQSKTIDFTW